MECRSGGGSKLPLPTSKVAEGKQKKNTEMNRRKVGPPGSNVLRFSRSVGPKELKENLIPAPSTPRHPVIEMSSSKRSSSKSMVGYMELKRVNHELQVEVQALHEEVQVKDSSHLGIITQLSKEIEDHRNLQAQLRNEIAYSKDCLKERNNELDALQQSLEDIKFENDRMTSILERAKIDVAAGERIEETSSSLDHQHHLELEFLEHSKQLDACIGDLEQTLTELKDTQPQFQDLLLKNKQSTVTYLHHT